MRFIKKVLFVFFFSFILPGMIGTGSARDFTNEEIFYWVVDQLKIEKDYPLPTIHVIDRQELQKQFKENNHRSFQRWAQEFGPEKAKKIIEDYLREVVGLFDPKSKIIYVNDFDDPCREASIIAHEITHYLQVMDDIPVSASSVGSDTIRLFRELQAGNLEKTFKDAFCARPGLD